MTGAQTFLFTDIEGSTRSWQLHGDLMGQALAVHDRLLTQAVESHGGDVFKHTGDGVCAVFADSVNALAAAAAAQRALAEADWGAGPSLRVRMGLHTGVAEQRDDDWFGSTLNRAARVMAAGHGGQVLCTRVTAELAAGRLPADLDIVELGEFRLRDLARPEHVCQMVVPGLARDFPPLRTLGVSRHNLPVVPTSFIGRESDLTAVTKLLAEAALVTLTGVGGVGKTRLALEVAAREAHGFTDGVFLVDLAAVSDPRQAASAVATAVGLMASAEGDTTPEAALQSALAHQQALLILDNCEHVLAAVGSIAAGVIAACPDVRLLATSREALGVPGEHLWPVRPLVAEDDLEPSEAMRLFAARAAAVRPEFMLDETSAPAVAEVCRRLDGLPLAIELAAARVRHLSVAQIAERLDNRFRLLVGGSRGDRHQTLKAAIDWSHEQLGEDEQRLFRRLGVFTGPFTLDAVEGICADDELDWVLDLLGSLVDKSLVVADMEAQPPRYRLLETVKVFAQEQLQTRGEQDDLRERHAEWYRRLTAPHQGHFLSAPASRAMEPHLANVKAAIAWSIEVQRWTRAAELLTGTMRYTAVSLGYAVQRLEWHRAVMRRPDLPPDLRAWCHADAAWLAIFTSAADSLDIAIDATQLEGTRDHLARAQGWIARATLEGSAAFSDASRREYLQEWLRRGAEELDQADAPAADVAAVRTNLANSLFNADDVAGAVRVARQALAELDREPGEEPMTWLWAHATVGGGAHLLGDHELAGSTAIAVVEQMRVDVFGRDSTLGISGAPLAVAAAGAGDFDTAHELIAAAAESVRLTGTPLGRKDMLVGLGAMASVAEDWERAALLLSAAIAQGSQNNLLNFRSPITGRMYVLHRDRAKQALGDERARALRDQGRGLTYEDAFALGVRR